MIPLSLTPRQALTFLGNLHSTASYLCATEKEYGQKYVAEMQFLVTMLETALANAMKENS